MPAYLIDEYQRNLRFHGVDIMSSTGGAVSSAHDERDIEKATDAFERTVISLEAHGLIHTIP
jgi:glutamate-1-semialdehyde aminotransferase